MQRTVEADGVKVIGRTLHRDANDASRGFAKRFMACDGGTAPGMSHGMTYAATLHHLQAAQRVGGDDPVAVDKAMREMPFTDGCSLIPTSRQWRRRDVSHARPERSNAASAVKPLPGIVVAQGDRSGQTAFEDGLRLVNRHLARRWAGDHRMIAGQGRIEVLGGDPGVEAWNHKGAQVQVASNGNDKAWP